MRTRSPVPAGLQWRDTEPHGTTVTVRHGSTHHPTAALTSFQYQQNPMKKNELIHLHALLVQVAEDYVDHGDATRDDFLVYDELGVTPMTLRASRATHERAVRTLLAILAARSSGDPLPETAFGTETGPAAESSLTDGTGGDGDGDGDADGPRVVSD